MGFYILIRTIAIWAALGLLALLFVAGYAFDLTPGQVTAGLAVLCGLVWLADRILIAPTR